MALVLLLAPAPVCKPGWLGLLLLLLLLPRLLGAGDGAGA
jgi:hypothetical protein